MLVHAPALVPASDNDHSTLDETREVLAATARRRFGATPHTMLVDCVLAHTEGADFAVREAAMDALVRRMGFAVRDGLVVASCPPAGRVLGSYTTARGGSRASAIGRRRRDRGAEARPYTSSLESVDPIRGSCDCPDYLRSSLALCKHLLVVLDHVHQTPARVADAIREQGRRAAAARTSHVTRLPRLRWDADLPLVGRLDRLLGLRMEATAALPREIGRCFAGGSLTAGVIKSLASRAEALRALAAALGRKARSARIDATPAARALVEEELARVERRLACEAAAGAASRHLGSLKRKLYPYQREGAARLLRAGRLLLADDMGLGKTTQAIAACHALFRSGRVRRGLLIVPASLKSQWLREWQDTTDLPASIVDGPPEDRARQYRDLDAGFLVMNYEQLLRDAPLVHALAPDLVVLDEAQRIKNYATKSAAYVKALEPTYRFVLTGTPMENRLEELASLLDWVDDVALAPKWRLVSWYTSWDGDGGKGKAGARHLETLRARLADCVMRRVRRDVLSQLPPRTDTRVPVEMTEQQRHEHDDLAVPIARLVRIARQRPLRQGEFLRLMQLLTQQRIISNGLGQTRFDEIWPAYQRARPDASLLEGLFAPKLLELRRLVADIAVEQERKVVVFSQWRRMLRLADWSVRDVLGDAGLRSVFFTGAESQAQRTRSVVDFHDDPNARVMFLSDAGGVGLNLQRAASACINLELPWNPAVLEQRIGRIYRLGQAYPIDVYNLVSEYGIEARIGAIVQAKQALFAGLFDGESDEIRFDSAPSFLTGIERLVDIDPPPPSPGATTGDTAHEALLRDDEDPDAPADHAVEPEAEAVPALPEHAPRALAHGMNGHANGSPNGAAASNERTEPAPANGAPKSSGDVGTLLRALRVQRTEAGGLRIEAPPEAAASLAALFTGLAELVAVAARPGVASPDGPG